MYFINKSENVRKVNKMKNLKVWLIMFEPHREKTGLLPMLKQRRRSAAQLTVFTTQIVQHLFFLNPKFQAFSFFLGLYRPICVGPGRKHRRPVFLRRCSFESMQNIAIKMHVP